jgi:ribosomal protein S18 acetylase RimI-like enzyme
MRQAYRNAYSCTLAEWNGMILGFQISTFFLEGAHLARLAVTPQAQGKGIGALLLQDLLQRFIRRGVYAMTVNTQSSNSRSLRLYQRFNFQPNGYDLPYWICTI